MSYASIYFSTAPAGGLAALVAMLREAGASRIGNVESPRVPIDTALESALLDYATHLEVRDEGSTWSARITAGPAWGIVGGWPGNDVSPAVALVDKAAALAPLDFAVVIR